MKMTFDFVKHLRVGDKLVNAPTQWLVEEIAISGAARLKNIRLGNTLWMWTTEEAYPSWFELFEFVPRPLQVGDAIDHVERAKQLQVGDRIKIPAGESCLSGSVEAVDDYGVTFRWTIPTSNWTTTWGFVVVDSPWERSGPMVLLSRATFIVCDSPETPAAWDLEFRKWWHAHSHEAYFGKGSVSKLFQHAFEKGAAELEMYKTRVTEVQERNDKLKTELRELAELRHQLHELREALRVANETRNRAADYHAETANSALERLNETLVELRELKAAFTSSITQRETGRDMFRTAANKTLESCDLGQQVDERLKALINK